MALTGALLTGLSGLVVNQTELNIAGNNIANANTTAFKASDALFSPQFYLTTSAGTPSNSTFGGTNPSQIGLGAQVAAVQQNFTQGTLQTTGVPTDLAVDGNGFFIVSPPGSTNYAYTRDGAFTVNSNNQLADSAGQVVNGYTVDQNFNLQTGKLTSLTIPPSGLESIAQATGTASLTGTLNTSGTIGTTGTILTSQALQTTTGGTFDATTTLTSLATVGSTTPLFGTGGQVITLTPTLGGSTNLPTQTLTVTSSTTVGDFENFLVNGFGIDTGVPTGSVPQGGGTIVSDASGSGQDLVITGNVGTVNSLSLAGTALTLSGGVPSPITFSQTAAANGESVSTPLTVYDSLGKPVTINVNAALVGETSGANPGTTWDYFVTSPNNIASANGTVTPQLNTSGTVGTLNFNTSGQLQTVGGPNAGSFVLNRFNTGATSKQNIQLNFGNVEALSGSTSTVTELTQDGFAAGQFNSFSIGTDGVITATYTNGNTETIGQIILATFANNNGLINQGGNQYTVGPSSGLPNTTEAPGTGATGTVNSGQLESSNVDLSTEFINLIIASTGYSASSKVISTSDQLLTDLLNSQR